MAQLGVPKSQKRPMSNRAKQVAVTNAVIDLAKQIKTVDDEAAEQQSLIEELNAQRQYKINIASTETQRDPVPVQIKGYAFNIPRDTEVEVPEAVVEVLRNAIVTMYVQRKRLNGDGQETIEIKSQRFPFSSTLVRGPLSDEVPTGASD